MTASVTTLRGTVTPGEPNPRVIAMLRELLAEAERGEIVGLAAATVTPGGTTRSTSYAAFSFGFTLLASIDIMHGNYRALVGEEG